MIKNIKLKQKMIGLSKSLFSLKKDEVNLQFKQKEEIEPMREKLAEILQYKNKKGETDMNQVKEKLVKDAVLLVKTDKENKLEADLSELLAFIKEIKENEDLMALADKVNDTEDEIVAVKDDYKAVKKEFDFSEDEYKALEDNNTDDKKFVKESEKIVSMKTKIYKAEKENEYRDARDMPLKDIASLEEQLSGASLFDTLEIVKEF